MTTARTPKTKPPEKQGGVLTQRELQKPRPSNDNTDGRETADQIPADGGGSTNPDDDNEPRRGGDRDL